MLTKDELEGLNALLDEVVKVDGDRDHTSKSAATALQTMAMVHTIRRLIKCEEEVGTAFAVIVTSREMRSSAKGNPVMTKEGERFWVTVDLEGWVEASSSRVRDDAVPGGVKLFETRDAAQGFAARWKGHPWWCQPNGEYEIVEIEPVFKKVVKGYKRVVHEQEVKS